MFFVAGPHTEQPPLCERLLFPLEYADSEHDGGERGRDELAIDCGAISSHG